MTVQLVTATDGSHLWSERHDRELDEVLRSDPLSLLLRWWIGVMAYLAGDADRAIAEGRRMIEIAETHFLGHWTLGKGLQIRGDQEDAVVALERANELSGGMPVTLGFLAQIYGQVGRTAAARELLRRAEERTAQGYYPPSVLAIAEVGVGDWDSALGWLDRAIEARDPLVMPVKTYPFLAPVRDDPRYHALLRKMNLS